MFLKCSVEAMSTSAAALKQRKPAGRPSKGDRHVMTTRVPTETAQIIFRLAEARGLSASEWLDEAAREKLARTDMIAADPQGAFELDKVS